MSRDKLFEDMFEVLQKDPDGKKFDRVQYHDMYARVICLNLNLRST